MKENILIDKSIAFASRISHDLSLTSAHLTRNDRDSLPTYAPLTLPKWQSNSEAVQKIGRYRK